VVSSLLVWCLLLFELGAFVSVGVVGVGWFVSLVSCGCFFVGCGCLCLRSFVVGVHWSSIANI